MSTTTTCARCSKEAVCLLNGIPLCRDHLLDEEGRAVDREDRMYAEEAARLGIEIPPAVLLDREFGPVCWLLSAPQLARRTRRFVDVDRRRVDWDALLEAAAPWSHYENLTVRIALNFWNGTGGGPEGDQPLAINLYELGGGFDRHDWQRVIEALALARGKRLVIFDPPGDAVP